VVEQGDADGLVAGVPDDVSHVHGRATRPAQNLPLDDQTGPVQACVSDRAADVDVDPIAGSLPPRTSCARLGWVAAMMARRTARRADVVGPAGRQQTAEEAVLPGPCWTWVDEVW